MHLYNLPQNKLIYYLSYDVMGEISMQNSFANSGQWGRNKKNHGVNGNVFAWQTFKAVSSFCSIGPNTLKHEQNWKIILLYVTLQ